MLNQVKKGTALSVVLVLLAMLFGSVPAKAGSGDNYPEPWRSAAQNAYVDNWGYYSRQCTSWVAWALHDRNGFEMPRAIGNGGQWGTWARDNRYEVNSSPNVGSVAWWGTTSSDQYGHVAWVKSVNPNGTVTIEEYNYAWSGNFNTRTIPASSPTGYIHFKDLYSNPGPISSTPRIISLGDGTLTVKNGSIHAGWEWIGNGFDSVKASPNRIAGVNGGQLLVKEGPLNATWVAVTGQVDDYQVTDNRVGMLVGGQVHIKDGPLNATWSWIGNGFSSFKMSSSRIAGVNGGQLIVKEGALNAPWSAVTGQVDDYEITNSRVGIRVGTQFHVKDGPLNATWLHVGEGNGFKLT